MKKHKKYLIALEETRSIVALISSIIVLFCTLAAVFVMIDNNLLSASGAAFMLPFAVEGIRKKRFILPRWVVLFQYAGATCVAITMITSLAIILPTQGIEKMTGANFWLHIVTPAATVILFQSVESGIAFRRRDVLISLAPYWTYMLIYSIMAVVIGEERGGWSDFYMTQAFWPAWVSVILMLTIGFAVSAALRIVQNRRAEQCKKRIARTWSRDLEPTQILIEAFGLGRYIGSKCSIEELTVPLDIFAMMSERYGVPAEKLTKAYIKGALDSIGERH